MLRKYAYRAQYLPPTTYRGARISVLNELTEKRKIVPYDFNACCGSDFSDTKVFEAAVKTAFPDSDVKALIETKIRGRYTVFLA